jgi:hypothetical protein
MDMTGSNGIFVVPAEHFPGLIALIATPLVLWAGVWIIHRLANGGSAGAQRLSGRLGALSFPAKASVVAMVIGATVHAAIVPTHWGDERVLAVLFILDALGFVGAAVWTIASRPYWQLVSAAMLGGTVAGYAFYLAKGWETADLVGMTVSLVELFGFFVVILSGHTAFTDASRRNRLVLSSLGASTAFIIGTVAATGTAAATASVSMASQVHGTSAMGAMGGGSSDARHSSTPSSMNGMDPASSQSSTTTMPNMVTTAPSTSSSSAMPGMGTSTTSGGMPTMPSAGSTPTGTMPSMPSPSGDSGNTGTGMPGMGGGGGSNSPLSLSTSSPAGNITWPLAMGSMGAGMQMVTPTCTTDPTTAQQAAAVSLVNQTVSAVAPFESLAAAKAAGYVPITPSGASVVHYANPAYLATPQTLDPGAIEALVYANTSHGAILVAAMYAMANNQVGQTPPMPGGCLTEWHLHTNLCFSNTSGAVVGVEHSGACAAGSTNHVTQPMIHVWLAPLTGGPLVVDAPDAQVVAAASQLPVPNPPNPTA